MTRKGKILNLVLGIALIATLFVGLIGCSSSGTSPTATPPSTQQTSTPTSTATLTEKTIKIGLITSLTGGSAPWGFAERGILEMYAKEVKDQGGLIIGNQRVNFDVISLDDQEGTPSAAVADANQLVYQNSVDIIVTLWGGDAFAIAGILKAANANGVKTIEFTSGWSPMTVPSDPTVFRFILDENAAAIATVAAAHKLDPAAKTVVIVNPDIADGHNGDKADTNAWLTEVPGGTVLDHVFYDTATVDYMPISSRIMAHNPDCIDFSGSSPGSIVQIAAQCRSLGFTGLFPTGVATFDGAPEGMVTIGISPDYGNVTPLQKHYAEIFKQEYGQYYPFWEYYGNGLYPLFHNFFQDAGSTDISKVYQTITAPGYTFDTWWAKSHWFGADVPIWNISRDIATDVPTLMYIKPTSAWPSGLQQLDTVPFSQIEPMYSGIKP